MEEWRDIKGYERLYQVSNYGRMRSVDRVDCANRKLKGREVKGSYDKDGYIQVSLSKNGIARKMKLHRLVAIAFIPNPENKPQVNHKDENKENNNIDNLEWVTHTENNNWGTKNLRTGIKNKESLKGSNNGSYKGLIYCKELNATFEGTGDAERKCKEMGIKVSSVGICCCISKKHTRKTCGYTIKNGKKIRLTWIRLNT